MRTYLIPTDFSASSVAAARYAASLSKQTGVGHLILLHSYYVSPFEDMLPSTEFVQMLPEDIKENIQLKTEQLNDLKAQLEEIVNEGVEVLVHLSRQPLLNAIYEMIHHNEIDLLVLCSRSSSADEDTQVGRNIIKISKLSEVPVLVVPKKAVAAPLKKMVLACDFKKVTEVIPQDKFKKVWDMLNAELLVVNVDTKGLHSKQDPKMLAEESALYEMMEPYQPQYFFINHTNTIQGIVDFATEQDAQLIIALPKKYSFFQSFLHNSITGELTVKSTIPVLILK